MITQKEIRPGNTDGMPITKLNGFLAQFAWAKDYINGPLSKVYVSRIEPAILTYAPQVTEDSEAWYSGWLTETLLLLDDDGKIVIREIPQLRRQFFFFGPLVAATPKKLLGKAGNLHWSVGYTLENLGEQAELVRFVFSYFHYNQAAIVYKAPKGISLPKWVEQQTRMEQEKFQTDCEAIDAEAANVLK